MKKRAKSAVLDGMNQTIALICTASALLMSSCSTRFHDEWRKAAAVPISDQNIEGRWEGQWSSAETGHKGRLRCVVGPALNSAGDHHFHYWAAWGRFFSGSFETTQKVKITGNHVSFHGEQRMPQWAGGTYAHDGSLENGRFTATYRSAKDHGSFAMTRPAAQ